MGEYVMSPLLLQANPDTATVVISGIFIVVAVLLLLIFVFQIFGKFVSGAEARAKAKADEKTKSAQKKKKAIPMPVIPTPEVPAVEDGIPEEVVAAIAGAIAAVEGPGAVVRSVRRKNVASRNPWAQAAQINNTRPF